MYKQEYPYTIEDVATVCKKTRQSIYNLSKKNSQFIDDNSITYQRRRRYNQAAMKFFTEYYGAVTPEAASSEATVNDEATQATSTQSEVTALQEEINRLNKVLEEKEAERKELFQQNNTLLLILQQEKQEKMLLLPAPRKPLGQRVKEFFKRDDTGG